MVGQGLDKYFQATPGEFAHSSRVVGQYRAPQPKDVAGLIDGLCKWLYKDFGYSSGKQSFIDSIIQAIVTHVYIEWIHPFDDGNGRTGRLLEFYILLRAGNPDIASHILSNFYNETRNEYYSELKQASQKRDLSSFISYALQGFHDGFLKILEVVQIAQSETAWRSYIFEKFAALTYHKKGVFKRRRSLVLNMPMGKDLGLDQLAILTPELAREYAKLSELTLKRDLKILIDLGLVVKDKDTYTINLEMLRIKMPQQL